MMNLFYFCCREVRQTGCGSSYGLSNYLDISSLILIILMSCFRVETEEQRAERLKQWQNYISDEAD